jgi:hypothetical protein
MEVAAVYKGSVRYYIAKRKIEENFLRWLSQPNTAQLVNKLLDDCKRHSLQVNLI